MLAESDLWKLKGRQTQAGLGRWEIFHRNGGECHLLWPLTFMNLSGQAIDKVLEAVKSEAFDSRQDLLVVIDDLSLELGKTRLRAKGSSGGHNGLKSVEAHVGHRDYARLKLGIGQPDADHSVTDFVLQPFLESELEIVERVLEFAAPQVLSWLGGFSVAELSQTVNSWTGARPQNNSESVPERHTSA